MGMIIGINQINALADGSTFRDKVLHWVVSMGITVDEINAFRKAVIDGNPDIINLTSTVPVTWLNGQNCSYTENADCTVSTNANYLITEKLPVEYGKTYTLETTKALPGGTGFYFIGINANNIVTERINPLGDNSTKSWSWTPTKSSTVALRIRTYSSNHDIFATCKELKVS